MIIDFYPPKFLLPVYLNTSGQDEILLSDKLGNAAGSFIHIALYPHTRAVSTNIANTSSIALVYNLLSV